MFYNKFILEYRFYVVLIKFENENNKKIQKMCSKKRYFFKQFFHI